MRKDVGTSATVTASKLGGERGDSDEDCTIERYRRRRSMPNEGVAAARRAQPKKRSRSVEKQRPSKSVPPEVRLDGRRGTIGSDNSRGAMPPNGPRGDAKSARQQSSCRTSPTGAEMKSGPKGGLPKAGDGKEGGLPGPRKVGRPRTADKAAGKPAEKPGNKTRGKRGRGPAREQAKTPKRARDGENRAADGVRSASTSRSAASRGVPVSKKATPPKGTKGAGTVRSWSWSEGKGSPETDTASERNDKAATEVGEAGTAGAGQKGRGRSKGIIQDQPVLAHASATCNMASGVRRGGKDAAPPRTDSSARSKTTPPRGGTPTPGRKRSPKTTPDNSTSRSDGTVVVAPKIKSPAWMNERITDATECPAEEDGARGSDGAAMAGGSAAMSAESSIFGLKLEKKAMIEVLWQTEKETGRKETVKVLV